MRRRQTRGGGRETLFLLVLASVGRPPAESGAYHDNAGTQLKRTHVAGCDDFQYIAITNDNRIANCQQQ